MVFSKETIDNYIYRVSGLLAVAAAVRRGRLRLLK